MLVAGAVAGGAGYAAGRRRGEGDQAEYEEDEQGQDQAPPAPPAPAAAAPAADDETSELERLASMHDSGVLTDDEFTAAKAKILGT
jgi:membrane protease subunit (stomatin/prohibitin family)